VRGVRVRRDGTLTGRPAPDEPVDLGEKHFLAAGDDSVAPGQLRPQIPRNSFGIVRVAYRADDGDVRVAYATERLRCLHETLVGKLLVAQLDDVDTAAKRCVQQRRGILAVRACVQDEIEA
jgi:hypothetical protein